MTPAITRRDSHLECEADEEAMIIERRAMSVSFSGKQEALKITPKEEISCSPYEPKLSPKGNSPKVAPNVPVPDAVPCNHDLVNMAEAEEHSLLVDRRQMSAMDAETWSGERVRLHAEGGKPANFAVETPQNNHHLAGLAEAEEMAWGLDRQVSAAMASGQEREVLGRRRRPSEEEPETAKKALARRCSHDLVASAEAEEIAFQLDRQASGRVAGA